MRTLYPFHSSNNKRVVQKDPPHPRPENESIYICRKVLAFRFSKFMPEIGWKSNEKRRAGGLNLSSAGSFLELEFHQSSCTCSCTRFAYSQSGSLALCAGGNLIMPPDAEPCAEDCELLSEKVNFSIFFFFFSPSVPSSSFWRLCRRLNIKSKP